MWIEVFRTGNHTDKNGIAHSYDAETLKKITVNYNERVNNHPNLKSQVIKDHLKGSKSLGLVNELRLNGDKLLADIEVSDNETMKSISEGKLKNVSIGINENNLDHISFLESELPAVEGLLPIDATADDSILQKNVGVNYQKENVKKEFKKFIEDKSQDSKLLSLPGSELAVKIVDGISGLEDEEFENITTMLRSFIEDLSKNYLLSEYSANSNPSEFNYNYNPINSNPNRLMLHYEILREMKSNPNISYEQAMLKIID